MSFRFSLASPSDAPWEAKSSNGQTATNHLPSRLITTGNETISISRNSLQANGTTPDHSKPACLDVLEALNQLPQELDVSFSLGFWVLVFLYWNGDGLHDNNNHCMAINTFPSTQGFSSK